MLMFSEGAGTVDVGGSGSVGGTLGMNGDLKDVILLNPNMAFLFMMNDSLIFSD